MKITIDVDGANADHVSGAPDPEVVTASAAPTSEVTDAGPAPVSLSTGLASAQPDERGDHRDAGPPSADLLGAVAAAGGSSGPAATGSNGHESASANDAGAAPV